jgi:hypothetical protein
MTTDTLASGASLTAGQMLVSQNLIFTLTVSPNGLMFMTNTQNGQRYWVVGKLGQGNPVLTMQMGDGNLVLREGNPPQVQFASGTSQFPGAYARLLGNGNLVVYDVNGNPIWSSNTAQGAVVIAPLPLFEAKAALEVALGNLAVVQRALLEIQPGPSAPEVIDRSNEASVNVRNYGAHAE